MTTATAPRTRTPAEGVHRTKTHQYYFSGAGPWPGVTSVTKVLDAPALTYWKMNQVAQAAIAGAERLIEDREAGKTDAAVKYLTTLSTTAMDRGSRIHASIEPILRREPAAIDPRDEAAVAGARAWLNPQATEHGLRPLEVEAFLLHETLGYGGTCDLIAELDGEVWLLDWKTGSSVATPDGTVYRDHRLQLAAYANAEFIARVNDPERYPLPAITRYGLVHVTDGGTRLYEAFVTAARLGRLPRRVEPLRLVEGEGGVSIDRARLAGCSVAALAVLGFWTLVVVALWCLCRLVWP